MDLVPEKPPYGKTHPNTIPDLVAETEANSDIKICKSTKIKSINGQPGQFEVSIETPSGEESFKAGAIVQGEPWPFYLHFSCANRELDTLFAQP